MFVKLLHPLVSLFLLSFMVAFIPSNAGAQHSLSLDNGPGSYSTISVLSPGGNYILPAGGGTILTSVSLSSFAWVLGGNAAPPSNIFGTTSATDVDMRTNNTTQLTLLTGGGINIPVSTATGTGIIFQNGTSFIHSFGTNNLFM